MSLANKTLNSKLKNKFILYQNQNILFPVGQKSTIVILVNTDLIILGTVISIV